MSSPRWLMTSRLPKAELTANAIAGDEAAVDALVRAWLPHVYRWCHRMGGPGFDSEDTAHEVLITMVRRLHTVRDPAAFPAWLFGITRRTMANHRRRAWWKRWLPAAVVEDRPSEDAGPLRSFEAMQAHQHVWDALMTLKPIHREVLVLCELEERSATEAASLLGIPAGTVKSRLRAARNHFRLVLGDEHNPQILNVGGV